MSCWIFPSSNLFRSAKRWMKLRIRCHDLIWVMTTVAVVHVNISEHFSFHVGRRTAAVTAGREKSPDVTQVQALACSVQYTGPLFFKRRRVY